MNRCPPLHLLYLTGVRNINDKYYSTNPMPEQPCTVKFIIHSSFRQINTT